MRFELTKEQQQLKQEIRTYLETHITPELLEELKHTPDGGPIWREYIKQMGRDGWLGIGWPKEYGGQGRTPLEQYIFLEEVDRSGVNIPFITLETVGPTLMKLGTEKQKEYFLPRILKGEVEIAVGYSEPQAGTDLAALETRAEKDGDDYIINGQKVFTTMAHVSDYIWLAARTDPNVPKHKGISIFLVPTNAPGFSVTPMNLMGERSNVSYYDNVRVSKDALVGEENMGWQYITTQLSLERLMLSTYSKMKRTVEETIEWAKETVVDGKTVFEQDWVQEKLSELIVKITVLKHLNYRAAWGHSNEKAGHYRPSMNKVYAAELHQEVYDTCMQIMGMYGQLSSDSKWAPIKGRAESHAKKHVVFLFGGGASEVMRDLVARFALELPKT
ncbi:acyl-CoA dehydrogenase family protein [Bacillus sp. AGMB 02131]|uniref:Acyl-CoA dehydrogenase family protein n=1 Tax=Peribacillus faecalis TaxID=2772559 RepID=A0A927HAA6_9BACI|nr:acyl-CoA dehydrogenase family protein [Peribacillus faecalis]MBD3107347.1 acyl-CoA dehydrogenase family protein [Peribacillus faecalis]